MVRGIGSEEETYPLSYAAICPGSHMLPKEFSPRSSRKFHTYKPSCSRGNA